MTNIIISIVGVFASILLCILTIATNRLFKRFDEIKADLSKDIDEAKADTNKRFDEAKADVNKRFDEAKADVNKRFDEVKADIKTTETRLTGSINEVKADVKTTETRLTGSINGVKADVKAVADRLQRHEDKCAARDIQVARLLGNLENAVTGKIPRDKISGDEEET